MGGATVLQRQFEGCVSAVFLLTVTQYLSAFVIQDLDDVMVVF